MRSYLGLVVGTKSKEGALCYADVDKRPASRAPVYWSDAKHEGHYLVRILERIPPGEPIEAICDRLLAIMRFSNSKGSNYPLTLVLDITDWGSQLFHLVEARFKVLQIESIRFTGDLEKGPEQDAVTPIGKGWMATRLGILLSQFRLHLPSRAEIKQMAEEIFDLEIPGDLIQQGPGFKLGSHDALVSALGLAVHREVRFRPKVQDGEIDPYAQSHQLGAPAPIQAPRPIPHSYGPTKPFTVEVPQYLRRAPPITVELPQHLRRTSAVPPSKSISASPADDPAEPKDDRPDTETPPKGSG